MLQGSVGKVLDQCKFSTWRIPWSTARWQGPTHAGAPARRRDGGRLDGDGRPDAPGPGEPKGWHMVGECCIFKAPGYFYIIVYNIYIYLKNVSKLITYYACIDYTYLFRF